MRIKNYISPIYEKNINYSGTPQNSKIGFKSSVYPNKYMSHAYINQNETRTYMTTLGNNIKAFLQIQDDTCDQRKYSATLFNNVGTKLGKIVLTQSEYKSIPHLMITDLYSKVKGIGVGVKLVQVAVEKSLKSEANGRLNLFGYNFLNTQNDPFMFYFKTHFTLNSPDSIEFKSLSKYIKRASQKEGLDEKTLIKKIEQLCGEKYKNIGPDYKLKALYESISELNRKPVDEINLPFEEHMYLNLDAVEDYWKPKVLTNPILCNKNLVKRKG